MQSLHVYAQPTIDYPWRRPGGPALYAARAVGAPVLVHGPHGGEPMLIEAHVEAGAKLPPPSGTTTRFLIAYEGGSRSLHLIESSPLVLEGYHPVTRGYAALVSPVVEPPSVSEVAVLESKFKAVLVDLQGWCRRAQPGSRVEYQQPRVRLDSLGAAAVKASADEVPDPEVLLEEALSSDTPLLLTLGARGSIVVWRGVLYYVSAVGGLAEDPTGLGDAYAAAAVLALARGATPVEAAVEGTVAAARLLGYSGEPTVRRLSFEDARCLLRTAPSRGHLAS